MNGNTHGGKGSARRKALVSSDQFDNNWDRIFRTDVGTIDQPVKVSPAQSDLTRRALEEFKDERFS